MDLVERRAAFAAARDICRRHARSFYFASHFLPQFKRERAYSIYAFCRLIDDAIDRPDSGEASVDALAARLAALGSVLDQVYCRCLDLPQLSARTPAQHALAAFAETVHACEIPRQYFLDLIDGCRMDIATSCYADWQALETYCYRVAGVVGLIMCRVFDLHEPAAHAHAVMMGNAMQLTNILRDVREDLERGRIYLPADEMSRFGVSEADLASGKSTAGFIELMRFQIARARNLYRAGAVGLRYLADDGSRQTACIMATVYGGILGAIERCNYDVFTRRAHLTFLEKLARLPMARKLADRDWDQPVPDIF